MWRSDGRNRRGGSPRRTGGRRPYSSRAGLRRGREVFAVPGFVKAETSRGPNGLIKHGAKLVEHIDDVLKELLPQFDAPIRERVMNRIGTEATTPVLPDDKEAVAYNPSLVGSHTYR